MKRGHYHMDRVEIVDYRSSWNSVFKCLSPGVFFHLVSKEKLS